MKKETILQAINEFPKEVNLNAKNLNAKLNDL